MGFRIGERQRAPPRPAENQPALDPEHFPEALDIRHQMPRGIRLQARIGSGTAAAALVEQEHAIALRIEQLAMNRREAAARAPVQEYRRLPVRVSAQLPINSMAIS